MSETFGQMLERVGRTDKHTRHRYGLIYEQWFTPFRDKPIRILEVGVAMFGGGSLLALAEYFPNATIHGCDNDLSKVCQEVRDHSRVRLTEHDAYADSFPRTLGAPPFDIIIDDCYHQPEFQTRLARMLRPHCGGFYVIEDCHTECWNRDRMRELWAMGWRHTLIDASREECWDDVLIRLDPV